MTELREQRSEDASKSSSTSDQVHEHYLACIDLRSRVSSCCYLASSIAKMWCLTSRERLEVMATDYVGR